MVLFTSRDDQATNRSAHEINPMSADRLFAARGRRAHGQADLGDVVAARGWLESIDWIDSERVGVMGGSYVGYLTLRR